MRPTLNRYIFLIFSQIFIKLSALIHTLGHWYSIPFSEPWNWTLRFVHCDLRSARADRHPSSLWAAPLGRFSSGWWRLFVSIVPQRAQFSLLDLYHASERPKSPLLGETGRVLERYHLVSRWLVEMQSFTTTLPVCRYFFISGGSQLVCNSWLPVMRR